MLWMSVLTAYAEVRHFQHVDDAVQVFTRALEARDKSTLDQLFTPEEVSLLPIKAIGDDDIDYFLDMYAKSHRLASFDGKAVYLEVGEGGWTFPVPLVKDSIGWSFDLQTGKENITIRQIGRNEMALIEALQDSPDLESLQASLLAEVYTFIQDSQGDLIALPKAYGERAIKSFILKKDGLLLESDLGGDDVVDYERFKAVDERYLHPRAP